MELYCKNCGHQLEESDKYCRECGQKTDDVLTIKVLFSNTISNYFSVDARFFISFLPLLFRPGYLPARFVEGKRLKYLHPAQFYLFVSVVFFFLLSVESREQQQVLDRGIFSGMQVSIDSVRLKELDSVNKAMEKEKALTLDKGTFDRQLDSLIGSVEEAPPVIIGGGQSVLDSLIHAGAPEDEKLTAMGYRAGDAPWKKKFFRQALKIYEKRGGGLLEAFYDTIPVAMFFLLPVFALLLKLLFFRRGKFAHHLVFSFYYFSFLFMVFSLLLLINMILDIPYWIDLTLLFSTFVYLLLGIRNFYQTGFGQALWKTCALIFLYLVFIMPTSAILLAGVTFLLY